MGNTAREINEIVAEAARKKKEMDAKSAVDEKADFINTAVDFRKKLERNLKKDVKGHSKVLLYIVICTGIFFTGYLIFQIIYLYLNADKDDWKIASVRVEDYEKAQEFVKNSFEKYKIDLDQLFCEGSPLTWRNNAKLIIEGMKDARYEVSSATVDTKNRGNEALLKVTCSAKGKKDILFYIILENDVFRILRIEKSN